jgi:hypothetical protein
MSYSRREFMTTSAMVVGVCATALADAKDAGAHTPATPCVSAVESGSSEICGEPLLFGRGHCSGYPYALPEVDEPWAISDRDLHNPEIENKW